VAVVDQVNVRTDPAVKAEYDAIAAALDVPAATIYRELLERGLPEYRQKAQEAVKQRGHWPGGIPAAAVEAELSTLVKAIARSEPLSILPRDLYGPRAKALLCLLSWLWGESSSAAEVKARDKLAAWLATLNIKATVSASASPVATVVPQYTPPPKPVKSYPRRGTE
jgi:hypothetical protein